MAKFNSLGLDEIISDVGYHQAEIDEMAPEIVQAQSEILVKAQKQEAETLKVKLTGDMIDSIKATKIKKDKNGASYIDIYPQGTDRNGVRNAEKGFIAEYGTSKIPARPWMRTANEKSEDAIGDKAVEIYDQKMNERND